MEGRADEYYRLNTLFRCMKSLSELHAICKRHSLEEILRYKTFLHEWAALAKKDAVYRHLEARAERWNRTNLLKKVMMLWLARAGVETEIGWNMV